MIKLTCPLGYTIYISPSHIEMLELTTLDRDKPEIDRRLGVNIFLSSGKVQPVEECLRDINKLIKDYWDQV